jgi:hypothetical protein
MKRLILPAALGMAMMVIIAACSPPAPATPPPTPTPAEPPTPTVPVGRAKICAVDADGTPATSAYVNVTNGAGEQVIPSDGSTGIMISASSGCRSFRLPPGPYHVVSQKVVSLSEYISGETDFQVTLESTVVVKVVLTGS